MVLVVTTWPANIPPGSQATCLTRLLRAAGRQASGGLLRLQRRGGLAARLQPVLSCYSQRQGRARVCDGCGCAVRNLGAYWLGTILNACAMLRRVLLNPTCLLLSLASQRSACPCRLLGEDHVDSNTAMLMAGRDVLCTCIAAAHLYNALYDNAYDAGAVAQARTFPSSAGRFRGAPSCSWASGTRNSARCTACTTQSSSWTRLR